MPYINWNTCQNQALDSKIICLINTNSLQQHVNEPTTQNNILDRFMTSPDLRIIELEVTDQIGDHQMIDFAHEIYDPNTRTQEKHVLDYKRTKFKLLKGELDSINNKVLMRQGLL
ncbi:hypothetical protein FHG87_021425 [Trinorchestia longiramus]|nr:hypothetical protein FHG87_021425 [Trinorchestia longiramus]